jgi:Fe2+ or Zn2+ uptake regulation protein
MPDLLEYRHRLVCRSCGDVCEVARATGTPCLDPADTAGYAVEAAEVVSRGLCPACRADPARP